MPIFRLDESIAFPPVELSTKDGILAMGGDLSPERLVEAYKRGIFPWYSEPEPILWWSPDPRCVLFPHEAIVTESMARLLKKKKYHITADTCFRDVMIACAGPRKSGPGTWITADILLSYTQLHEMGLAHSIEVWEGDYLAGGLYGVSLGSIFVGESMFHRKANASKVAFIALCHRLAELGFMVVDCQVYSPHLESLGAWELPRNDYLKLLSLCLQHSTRQGSWEKLFSGYENTLSQSDAVKRTQAPRKP
ncbi:MAG: leucyl/phenylalanyl-tRNA--protein transferase [Spirochaetaceae bacterium]|nr:MAG: leucyl/phenylalanyl-tRNA--protein transferase [Spirochaetaceae bacterium]